jgi:hypothetical protein
MNVEIGTEAAQFPEKEYINGIAVAVHAFKAQLRKNIYDLANGILQYSNPPINSPGLVLHTRI